MMYHQQGSPTADISLAELKQAVFATLDKIGPVKKVLAIPPDATRFHSLAGPITRFVWEYYGSKLTDILPALGTHAAMTDAELSHMFGSTPLSLFRVHNWRKDLFTLGEVPQDFVEKVSEGRVHYPWIAQVNNLLVSGGFDLILSIGQIVPHEVIGLANYNKNLFVGTGGQEGINKSHYLGAAYGMERIMGRALNPVRAVMNYATDHFGHQLPHVVYLHTVLSRRDSGGLALRGFYAGDDLECFTTPAALSAQVNITHLDKPLKKVVCYLEPGEFRSTWLGNKSVYRTRMALADQGELIVLAPGLKEFGEDKTIDGLIRKYGYKGTPRTLELVEKNVDLRENLSAAAHLIHGSSEGRFSITYCPGNLSREEIEGVGFKYADLAQMTSRYNPEKLKDGFNTLPDGEEIFFISNPAVGLWAWKEAFARQ